MARRRYLLAYDIRDERRLRAVATCVESYGERLQYSVFICDLSDMELVHLRTDLEALVRTSEDSVMVVDLGALDSHTRILFIGQHPPLPDGGATIV